MNSQLDLINFNFIKIKQKRVKTFDVHQGFLTKQFKK